MLLLGGGYRDVVVWEVLKTQSLSYGTLTSNSIIITIIVAIKMFYSRLDFFHVW